MVTIGAVVRAEDRILPFQMIEDALGALGGDAPRLIGLVARTAAATVGAETLEERSAEINVAIPVRIVCLEYPGFILEREQVGYFIGNLSGWSRSESARRHTPPLSLTTDVDED